MAVGGVGRGDCPAVGTALAQGLEDAGLVGGVLEEDPRRVGQRVSGIDRQHRPGRGVQAVRVLGGVGVDAGGEGVEVGAEVVGLLRVPDRPPLVQSERPDDSIRG
jgi:hypothetical protein